MRGDGIITAGIGGGVRGAVVVARRGGFLGRRRRAGVRRRRGRRAGEAAAAARTGCARRRGGLRRGPRADGASARAGMGDRGDRARAARKRRPERARHRRRDGRRDGGVAHGGRRRTGEPRAAVRTRRGRSRRRDACDLSVAAPHGLHARAVREEPARRRARSPSGAPGAREGASGLRTRAREGGRAGRAEAPGEEAALPRASRARRPVWRAARDFGRGRRGEIAGARAFVIGRAPPRVNDPSAFQISTRRTRN